MLNKLTIQPLKGNYKNHGMFSIAPELVITHAMGQYINSKFAPYAIIDFASFHFCIDVDGIVYACLADNMIAWHAGKSEWKGKSDLNRISIGIEWLVSDAPVLAKLKAKVNDTDNPPFTEAQYIAGSQLYAKIMRQYNLDVSSHVMHSDVSTIKVRKDPKFDPGLSFDFQRLNSMINAELQKISA